MANVWQCRKGTLPNNLECVFRSVSFDDNGEQCNSSCSRGCRDVYNLYPEHDFATGEINYQPTSNDPFRIGDMAQTWENLTGHQTGKNFDYRDFDADTNMHPLYSVSEHNYPTKPRITIDDVGDVFGDDNPAIVHSGWNTEKFYGISNVEMCNRGIYGRFDKKSGMVKHPCLISHIGVPGWVNYTTRNETVKKTLYLGYATDQEIIQFATNLFSDKRVAKRMIDGMIAVKNGEFINLWLLMCNNFVGQKEKSVFMTKVSIKSPNSIYKGHINLANFISLFHNIRNLSWREVFTDENSVEKSITHNVHRDIAMTLSENILNWILNYPELQKITLNNGTTYPTNKRYWFLIPMLRDAMKRGILNKKAMLPQWLVDMIKEKNEPEVRIFGQIMKYNELPEDIKDDYHEAQYHHLDTENKMDLPSNLYPGMLNIKKELAAAGISIQDTVGTQGWGQFLEILKLGRRWSMREVQTAFEQFIQSWCEDKPSLFYDWLDIVVNAPLEPTSTVSKEEFDSIVQKIKDNGGEGLVEVEPEDVQEMEAGCPTMYAEGTMQSSRAFAANILQGSLMYDRLDDGSYKRIMWDSWDEWKAINASSNWHETKGKISHARETSHETFYAMLAKAGIFKKDVKEMKKHFSNEAYEEAMNAHADNIASLESVISTGLDGDEIVDLKGYDPSSDEFTNLTGQEGIWLGEE